MNGFLRVSQIMSIDPVCVPCGSSVVDAARIMGERDTGSVLVTDGPRLVGILTERDLARFVADAADAADVPRTSVDSIMSTSLSVLDPDGEILSAARLMAERRIRHVPIVEEDRVLGIVSIRDIVDWAVKALAWTDVQDDARETLVALGGDALVHA